MKRGGPIHVLMTRPDGSQIWCRPLYAMDTARALEIARVIFDNSGLRGGSLAAHAKKFRTKGETERRAAAAAKLRGTK